MAHFSPENKEDTRKNKLKDRVILIINGLSESGRVLAVMLAQQGSDVAIVDFAHNPTLARHICHDVEAEGQRCLVITSDSVAEKKPFLEVAMRRIVDSLGRLDSFISYSAANTVALEENGRLPQTDLFDQDGLTIAALRHMHTQNSA